MTFALHDLRELLGPKTGAVRGVVVSTTNGTARVATKDGLLLARYTGVLAPNDRVLVENGYAVVSGQPSNVYSV